MTKEEQLDALLNEYKDVVVKLNSYEVGSKEFLTTLHFLSGLSKDIFTLCDELGVEVI